MDGSSRNRLLTLAGAPVREAALPSPLKRPTAPVIGASDHRSWCPAAKICSARPPGPGRPGPATSGKSFASHNRAEGACLLGAWGRSAAVLPLSRAIDFAFCRERWARPRVGDETGSALVRHVTVLWPGGPFSDRGAENSPTSVEAGLNAIGAGSYWSRCRSRMASSPLAWKSSRT